MPKSSHRFFIDETARLVYVKVGGSPTAKEATRFLMRVFGDPRYAPGYSVLSDRRDVETTATDAELAKAKQFLSNMPECLWALVVSRKAQMDQARKLEATLGETRVTGRVFFELDEAFGWLGIDDAPTIWHRNQLE